MLYLVRSRSSPHTRNVLWKCCRSVISMIGYDAAAGHVVLIECHHSLLSMIWADLLLQWRSCEFFFGQNKHFVYLQVPGIEIVMDRLLQNPTDEYTHAPRSAGNTFIHACVFFFSVPSTRIFASLLCQAPSLTQLISGVTRPALLSLPQYRACLRLITRKNKFRVKFPSLASPCVELVCIHATQQYNTQHAGCEALSAVSVYSDAIISGLELDPDEHTTSYLAIIYFW